MCIDQETVDEQAEVLRREDEADDENFLELITDRIVAKLSGCMISSAFPAHVGEYIRESTRGHQRQCSHWIYLTGNNGLQATYHLEVDGAMRLELATPDGEIFWRGTFRPVKG